MIFFMTLNYWQPVSDTICCRPSCGMENCPSGSAHLKEMHAHRTAGFSYPLV